MKIVVNVLPFCTNVSHFWRTLWSKLGTKILFLITCHSKTNGQTDVVNRTLGTLLRTILKKKLKANWELCLPHIEFAYNRVLHSTTNCSPLEIVYGLNPLTPLRLLPMPNMYVLKHKDAQAKADYERKLHEKVKAQIEFFLRLSRKTNKGRKKVIFEPRDWVWVHMRKEKFLEQGQSKLQSRRDGHFQVLEKINDNAYKIDLPSKYNVSSTFNVSDLSPFTR